MKYMYKVEILQNLSRSKKNIVVNPNSIFIYLFFIIFSIIICSTLQFNNLI